MKIIEIPKDFTQTKRENADSLFNDAIDSFRESKIFNIQCYTHLMLFYQRIIYRKEKWYASAELYINAQDHLQLRKQVEEKALSGVKASNFWNTTVDDFLNGNNEKLNAINLHRLLENIIKYMDENNIEHDKNIEIEFTIYTS